MEKESSEQLLESLSKERGNFMDSREKVMQDLIDGLVKDGIYPSQPTGAMKKYGYSLLDMVKGWGIQWYTYSEPFNCPHCNFDLRDLENGPPFKREIGMSDIFLDRTTDFVCPDCYRSIEDGRQYDKEAFKKAEEPIPPEMME